MKTTLAERPAWWQWPTVLSLDAPVVAVVWQGLFAHVANSSLRVHHYALLAAATWLVYAADRWMEGFDIDPARVCTQRHRFYQQHRRAVAAVIALVATGALVWAGERLTATEWRWGLALSLPVAGYLVVGPMLRQLAPWRLPKEFLIALLFAGGTAYFSLAAAGDNGWRLAAPLAWFAGLCLVNLALIARWEREVDAAHGHASLALIHPGTNRWIRLAPWLLAAIAGLAAACSWGESTVTTCVASSALLLGLLDCAEPHLGRQLARAIVDATLLTPLIALWWS